MLSRISGPGDSGPGCWRLGTRPEPDSPGRGQLSPLSLRRFASSGLGDDTGSPSLAAAAARGRVAQLETALADARSRIAEVEEDVLALQFAASAPEEVADLLVTFHNPHLQVGCGLNVGGGRARRSRVCVCGRGGVAFVCGDGVERGAKPCEPCAGLGIRRQRPTGCPIHELWALLFHI
jgi:hypothetical protein